MELGVLAKIVLGNIRLVLRKKYKNILKNTVSKNIEKIKEYQGSDEYKYKSKIYRNKVRDKRLQHATDYRIKNKSQLIRYRKDNIIGINSIAYNRNTCDGTILPIVEMMINARKLKVCIND